MKKHRTPNTVHRTLSVVLLTRNEQSNIGDCLHSVREIADEIVVVDEESSDKTREIARSYGAKVYKVKHEPIFHINKQKALEKATGDWILQLDADERVTQELGKEIKRVIKLPNDQAIKEYQKLQNSKYPKLQRLFKRHQMLIEKRDGKVGKDTRLRPKASARQAGEVVAFFIPRLNYFLGKPLVHAGLYPDANIRLVKRGKARFPAKSVHEQMEVEGEVAWLFNDLEHHDSPTLKRYLERANRYTDLHAEELQTEKVPKKLVFLFYYSFTKPFVVFLRLYIRHLGFLDGIRGFLWSLFSSLHYPLAYFKYWQSNEASPSTEAGGFL